MVDRDSAPDHSSFGVAYAPLICSEEHWIGRMYACLNGPKRSLRASSSYDPTIAPN
jgi:hypothetical protein